MKLSLLQETLQHGLSQVSHGLATRAQLPILGNILLEAKTGHLTLSTTNLEISLSLTLGAKVEEEGSVTLPGRTFLDLVNSLPKATVNLESDKDHLVLSCDQITSTLAGMAAEDFPPVPHHLETSLFDLDKPQLDTIVNQVSFAASTDDSRPVLTGVLFLPQKDKWQIVATDGFRLSLKTLPHPKTDLSGKWLVPARALQELLRTAEGKETDPIKTGIDDKASQIIFSCSNVVLASRLIEGDFPDFAKIVPSGFPTQITFDREDLLQAAKLASIFAREASNVIKLATGGEEIQISAESSKVGKHQSTIPAKIKGEGGLLAFNFRYLLDFLQSTASQEIILEMKDSTSPGVFKPASMSDYLHLIMPVRLQT